jgi:DNA-binding MarR family transcriptional regulator
MKICIYYNANNNQIIDILPKNISLKDKNDLEALWHQNIPRKILITISTQEQYNLIKLKEKIGHSTSTLHENIKKLEKKKLVTTKIIYEGNKQRIIIPNVLCITKNPKHKAIIKRVFQGLWVDSKNNKKVIEFLDSNPTKEFTIEEISFHTKIPVDDVELLLDNWESQATRAISNFLQKRPFTKRVLYKSSKSE